MDISAEGDPVTDETRRLAVARGLDWAELLERAETLLVVGMAYYGKTEGMIVVERDDVAYLTMLREDGIARQSWMLSRAAMTRLSRSADRLRSGARPRRRAAPEWSRGSHLS